MPPTSFGAGTLLNASDLKNIGISHPDDVEPGPVLADPFLDVILANPRLSPQAKALLRAEETERIQKERLRRELVKLEAERNRPGIVSWLGPIPIGLQLGTAIGVENWVGRLALDVLADPVNFVGFGLTGIGKATKLAKGLTASQKADAMVDMAKALALANTDDIFAREVSDAIASAVKSPTRLDDLFAVLRKAKKHKFSDEALESVRRIPEHGEDFVSILKGEKGARANLRALLNFEDKQRPLGQVRGFLNQIREGHRSIFSFGIPFTGEHIDGIILKEYADDIAIRRTAASTSVETAQKVSRHADDFMMIGKEGGILGDFPRGMVRQFAETPGPTLGALADRLPVMVRGERQVLDDVLSVLKSNEDDLFRGVSQATRLPAKEIREILPKFVDEFSHARKIDDAAVDSVVARALSGGTLSAGAKGVGEAFKRLVQIRSKGRFKTFLQSGQFKEALTRLSDIGFTRDQVAAFTERLDAVQRKANSFQKAAISIQKIADTSVDQVSKLQTRLDTIAKAHPDGIPKKGAAREEANLLQNEMRKIAQQAVTRIRPFFRAGLGLDTDQLPVLRQAIASGQKGAVESAMVKPFHEALAGLRGKAAAPVSQEMQGVAGLIEDVARKSPDGSGTPGAMKFTRELEADLIKAQANFETGDFVSGVARTGDEIIKNYDATSFEMIRSGRELGDTASTMQVAHRQVNQFYHNLLEMALKNDAGLAERALLHLENPRAGHLKAGVEDHVISVANEVSKLMRTLGRKLYDDGMIADVIDLYAPRMVVKLSERAEGLLAGFIQSRSQKLAKIGRQHDRVFETFEELREFVAKHPEDIAFAKDALGRSATRMDVAIPMYLNQMSNAYIRRQAFRSAAMLKDPEGMPVAIIGRAIDNDAYIGNQALAHRIDSTFLPIEHPLHLLDNVKVHPQFANQWKAIFDRDQFIDPVLKPVPGKMLPNLGPTIHEKFFNALDFISHFGRNIFRFSLYHGSSLIQGAFPGLKMYNPMTGKASAEQLKLLGEITIGSMRLPANVASASLKAMSKIATGSPGFGVGLKSMEDTIGTAARAGLNMFSRADLAGYDHFGNMLRTLSESQNPFIGALGRTGRSVNDFFDRNLWEVFLPNSKLQYWVGQRAAAIATDQSLLTTPGKLALVEQEIARFGNQIFGGLIWDKLFINPKMRRWLSYALIAPDWVASNILVARDLVLTAPGIRNLAFARALTPDVLMRDVRFKLARQYVLRSAVYGFVWANALNYAFTGKFLVDADEDAYDKETGVPRIELPYRRWDGRKQYMDALKQYTEPLAWTKPLLTGDLATFRKFLFPKLGPLPRLGTELIVGHNPGFDQGVVGFENGGFHEIMNAMKAVGSTFVPIPFQTFVQAASGRRDVRSAFIANMGFNVRSEAKDAAATREYEESVVQALGPGGNPRNVRARPQRQPQLSNEERLAMLRAALAN